MSAATHQGFEELLDETARQMEELPPILHFQEEVEYFGRNVLPIVRELEAEAALEVA